MHQSRQTNLRMRILHHIDIALLTPSPASYTTLATDVTECLTFVPMSMFRHVSLGCIARKSFHKEIHP
jgi:hypothetical protein